MPRATVYLAAASAILTTIGGRAVAIEGHASADPAVEALRKTEGAYEAAWDRAPMAARRVFFVNGAVKQHGAYDPRGDNAFRDTEKVVSYIEPVGFAFRELGNGVLAYGFEIGLKVKRGDGSVLLEKPNYAKLDSRTRSRKHDVEFDSSLDIKGLRSGTYTIDFAFRDLYSDKRMVVSQTFRVVD